MARIFNLNSAETKPLPGAMAPQGAAAERYAPSVAMVGLEVGAQQLGYNLIALAPGKRAFPFHNHRNNEEAFVILQGTGEFRLGSERHPVKAGDLIAALAGGPQSAHQIVNTGEVELRYLAISTRNTPDIIEYPDSGKYRVVDEARDESGMFDALHREVGTVGYWDGE